MTHESNTEHKPTLLEAASVELLSRAIRIAAQAHDSVSQTDKDGEPYIFHPLRMTLRARERGLSWQVQAVAALHDVLEDVPEMRSEIEAAGFPPEVLTALELVTKTPEDEAREQEDKDAGYAHFIERILNANGLAGEIARQVKLLDLEDNMDALRYRTLKEKSLKRIARYHHTYRRIQNAHQNPPGL